MKLLLLLIPLVLFSQKISEKFDAFTKVEIDLNANTVIEFGDEHSLEIDGREKFLKKINFEVKGDKLIIEMERNKGLFSFFNSYDEDEINIKIVIKKLEVLKLNGAGKTRIDEFDTDRAKIIISGANDLFTGGRIDQFEMDVRGASETDLKELICQDFYLDIKGAGDISLTGKTDTFKVDVKGAGDVKGLRFTTNYLYAKIMGAGDIRVTVEEEIEASIFGAGTITYKGNPKRIKDKIFGAGEIEKY